MASGRWLSQAGDRQGTACRRCCCFGVFFLSRMMHHATITQISYNTPHRHAGGGGGGGGCRWQVECGAGGAAQLQGCLHSRGKHGDAGGAVVCKGAAKWRCACIACTIQHVQQDGCADGSACQAVHSVHFRLVGTCPDLSSPARGPRSPRCAATEGRSAQAVGGHETSIFFWAASRAQVLPRCLRPTFSRNCV